MSERQPGGPVLIDVEEEALPPAPAPDPMAFSDPAETPRAMNAALRAARWPSRRRSLLGRLFWAAAAGLVGLVVSVTAYEFAMGLMVRVPWLGWAAWALLGLIALALALWAVRELAALARLRRIDAIRSAAAVGDARSASRAVDLMGALYANRCDLDWARTRVAERRGEALDGDALLALAERSYLTELDRAASASAARAARSVAAATAIAPAAALDVLAALALNLRMLREIGEIYGGRAGWFSSWRLLRAVSQHLIATGLIALGDDLVGPLVGGGAVAKLSRRFGEGVVNGALTARVGVAAIQVCRPLPFQALAAPTARAVALEALTRFRGKEEPETDQKMN